MESHAAEIAARVAGLRVPLSRIELAASQLLRVIAVPGARALALGISDAVAQLDDQIATTLQEIVGTSPSAAPLEDCRPVIEALRDRMAPALRARDVGWTDAADSAPATAVIGSRPATRHAALALLEGGLALADPDDRLDLSLLTEPGAARYGVALRVERARLHHANPQQMDRSQNADRDEFAAAARFVRTHGGELELRDEPSARAAVVWLTPGQTPCTV